MPITYNDFNSLELPIQLPLLYGKVTKIDGMTEDGIYSLVAYPR
jgi:hypothetical protein